MPGKAIVTVDEDLELTSPGVFSVKYVLAHLVAPNYFFLPDFIVILSSKYHITWHLHSKPGQQYKYFHTLFSRVYHYHV